MLRPDAPLASPEDLDIPICCRTGPEVLDVIREHHSRWKANQEATTVTRRTATSREPAGRRPRRPTAPATSSPDTGAGPSRSPARTTPCTTGGWSSTTSSTRRTPGPRERFEAVAAAIRDVLSQRWLRTQRTYDRANPKQVYYLSMEFLIGRSLANNIINLMLSPAGRRRPTRDKGLRLAELLEQEPDAGLGNGGLGRLAACFIDSLATLPIPAIGYGLRYDYGIFRQEIRDGYQVEHPDHWLARPDPWEVARPGRDGVRAARLAGSRSHAGQISVHRGQPIAPARRALRPAGGRLRRADDQHPAAVAGRDPGRLRLRRVQRRRLLRRRVGPDARRDGHPRPVPGRLDAPRPVAAVRPGVLPRRAARWPTSSPGSAAAGTTGRRCRTRSPSSSTTPTRRWPWPS